MTVRLSARNTFVRWRRYPTHLASPSGRRRFPSSSGAISSGERPAYRFALWLSDLAKTDVAILSANHWSQNNASQLLRAVEGISSNLAEGYGRSTGPERARYYDYARATAREARDWYFKARREPRGRGAGTTD